MRKGVSLDLPTSGFEYKIQIFHFFCFVFVKDLPEQLEDKVNVVNKGHKAILDNLDHQVPLDPLDNPETGVKLDLLDNVESLDCLDLQDQAVNVDNPENQDHQAHKVPVDNQVCSL